MLNEMVNKQEQTNECYNELYIIYRNDNVNTYKYNKFTDKQLNIFTLLLTGFAIFIMVKPLEIDLLLSLLTIPLLNRFIKSILSKDKDKHYTIFYITCIGIMELVFFLGVTLLY